MKKDAEPALIFVYNADSGLYNSLVDFTHKIFSPQTYGCNLCKLSFGNFNEKKEWKEFVSSFKILSFFFHRDEFENIYRIKKKKYPAVFWQNNLQTVQIISAEEINACNSTSALINLVKQNFLLYGIH